MAKVSIVYHSGFGHTAVQAKAVERGAKAVAGADVAMISVDDIDAHWDRLAQSDAIIFGCPTYMGSTSAKFKEFMDKTGKAWYAQTWKDKLAAGFTNSASQSGDKLITLTQLAIFAAQHSMIWVSLGLMPGNNSSTASVDDLNRLGTFLGAAAQSNNDEGPDKAPKDADQKTAEHLGKRVAELAARWVKGA